eukprot:CAMPEP_0202959826 /NCGR_PEP_ID=MMETSP1396-20130829/4003_1 /ASSEMBLY_ACC=CAM_ASM_000872 /TAXON_ID= /ORGANISM="Pseudokeronopsis sp., Strain Brazil" /LENGTH=121 /DNA_ID=CAMNT_0049678623 /DNA_START=191 /DNA_END=556 /DNA_ORIENTATION=+
MKLKDKLAEMQKEGMECDILITADTICSIDDKDIFEKPKDREDAYRMIRHYTKVREIDCYTSVWVAILKNDEGKPAEVINVQNILEKTKIWFISEEELDDETLWAYVDSGDCFGRAGGFGI